MKLVASEQTAQRELEKGYDKAEKVLNDGDKLERLLQRLEKKLKLLPAVGDALSNIPIMVSLVRSYIKKEYTDIPIGSIIAIISAIAYFVSPVDLLPDSIPLIGLVDDVAVVAACLKLVGSDVAEYVKWRAENNKTFDM
jgi:uncharacterized membrane protein YkvA (DUF1232 family)